ncbi:T9SS type A sorting domain-containing protein [Pedobacter sp. HMF7647]|uniref:T9SS type A sorting domain-containing protein n=1 Tax=Hufsiella arboris TaxID=2695275 RepID=A0A7K1Y8B4_9SPHI|nr:T9SS type A sorting domain-containing protein [Hufsiella arboris]MXV50660.1 T9SS type A sorting domain-containing protein [Hufsiella arboris]
MAVILISAVKAYGVDKHPLIKNRFVFADGCTPISTLPCANLDVSLPYTLNFNSYVANTIVDKNGNGTGFTMVRSISASRASGDGSPSNSSVPGYEPSKLTVSNSTLKILTNKGIASTTSNNQLNSLGVRVNSTIKLQIDTKIIFPYNGTSFQQGGLWFGLNDKTFLKLVAVGNKIEFMREINDVSAQNVNDQRVTSTISNLDKDTLRLRLIINPVSQTAEAFYSTDGINFLNVGASYATKTLSIAGMGLTNNTAYAGIYATYRNGSTPVTYTFDNFSVVEAIASKPTIALQNLDYFPSDGRLVFSLIQVPWRRTNDDGTHTPYNANHNKVKLRIKNNGTGTLSVSKLTLSNTSRWNLSYSGSLPFQLTSGKTIDVTIEFKAQDAGSRVALLLDQLTITSNDTSSPTKAVKLSGLWQKEGESTREPYTQEILKVFGFTTKTGYNHDDGSIDGSAVIANSDEVAASYFVKATSTKPVTVTQLAAYHGCCATTETIYWFDKGSSATTKIFTHIALDGQSLLPRKSASSTIPAKASFDPTGNFGFKVGSASSDRTKNVSGKIGIRVWQVKDYNGNIVANTYILGNDYLGTPYTNYDYQDNIYYVENIKLASSTLNASALMATAQIADSIIIGQTVIPLAHLDNAEQAVNYKKADSMIAENVQRNKITVYPNPVAGSNVSVRIDNFPPEAAVQVSILTMNGNISETHEVSTDNNGVAELTFQKSSKLITGIYLIRASTATTSSTAKLIVQ